MVLVIGEVVEAAEGRGSKHRLSTLFVFGSDEHHIEQPEV